MCTEFDGEEQCRVAESYPLINCELKGIGPPKSPLKLFADSNVHHNDLSFLFICVIFITVNIQTDTIKFYRRPSEKADEQHLYVGTRADVSCFRLSPKGKIE